MNILEIKNLNLAFNLQGRDFQALYDINLSLEKGKTLAIVGESGCGKTMSAMSVIRLLPNSAKILSGEILYNGENLLSLTENRMQKIRGKEIAYIPQEPMTSLNPLYSIGNQIKEILEIHKGLKGKEADRAAIEVLEQVKIPRAKERLNNYPHEFSGGMRQRVIIAMAIATSAPVIIADEPTTALDVTVQAQIMDLLSEIQKEYSTSIILISHNLALVSQNSDDIAVMYAGHIVENSKSKELFDNPKHPYTKALLKSLPTLSTTKLETIEGQPPSIREIFSGCPFEPRCSEKTEICALQKPKNVIVGNSIVNCWRFCHD
ncbi:ABC transporter ATP-binding protein [bacterium]|nr:ABC transporter ATP-binding protein [bacterium]